MTLTEQQSAWFDTVITNGMTVARAALDWAQGSQWASCETLEGAVECLANDADEGQTNGVTAKQAAVFLAVLRKACGAAATTTQPAPIVSRGWMADPTEAAKAEGWPARCTSMEPDRARTQTMRDLAQWRARWTDGGLEASYIWCNETWAWTKSAPGQPWIVSKKPNDDPTDYVSGWGNAYGD